MMTEYYKHPSIPHLPWSKSITADDIQKKDCNWFENKDVVVTEKLDGENCLSSETKISTDKGDVSIRDICSDPQKYKILSYNHEANSQELKDIINTSILSNNNDWYEIEVEDGTKFIATGNHRIWLNDLQCYRKVSDLLGNEEILLKK